MKAWARLAVLAALAYAAVAAVRPLNANDLFWHLATGREILRTARIPHVDPFSFTSGGAAWIDHEWLWQVVSEGAYRAAAGRAGPGPSASGDLALIILGAFVVVLAFGTALVLAARDGTPAAALVVLGILAVEIARERLMVRPETASLPFFAVVLGILGTVRPGLWRAALLLTSTALWANVHPAALLAPVAVFLHAVGGGSAGKDSESTVPLVVRFALEPALALAGTLANPYGWRLWTVPFQLHQLVRSVAFFNPEWLPPPFTRFPLFWAGALLCAAGAVLAAARTRRMIPGSVLVALLLAVLASREMRHMGLFAVASLFAAPAILRGLDPRGAIARVLDRRPIALAATLACALAAAISIPAWGSLLDEEGLDPGRFPVRACEAIAREAPDVRLYNDVRFGGYLIWRFFPPKQVFIDGRNELYPALLARLGGIASGEAPYRDWQALVRDLGIEGAIVRYSETHKGVIYKASSPGAPESRGWRAWSAFLFPSSEWALVWFDDTALVFMRRGGRGQKWIDGAEYRDLNPEDAEFLLERSSQDPAFAARIRAEGSRRLGEPPRCHRLEDFLARLDRVAPHGDELVERGPRR